MVFEGKVAELLQRLFSKFLHGFSRDQLGLALLSGKIALNKLSLRSEPLDALLFETEVPLAVKAGWIRSATAQLSIYNGEVTLELEGLQLVLGPLCRTLSRTEVLEHRRTEISRVEFLHTRNAGGLNRGTPEGSQLRKLFDDYLSKLKIVVKNAHVRLECEELDGHRQCTAFGACTEDLKVSPVARREGGADTGAGGPSPPILAEIVDVQGFSLYHEEERNSRLYVRGNEVVEAGKGAALAPLFDEDWRRHRHAPREDQLLPPSDMKVTLQLVSGALDNARPGEGMSVDISGRLENCPLQVCTSRAALSHMKWFIGRMHDLQVWQFLHPQKGEAVSTPRLAQSRWRTVREYLNIRRRICRGTLRLSEAIQMRLHCKEYVWLYKRRFNGPNSPVLWRRGLPASETGEAARASEIELLYLPDRIANFRLMAHSELRSEMALNGHLVADVSRATHNGTEVSLEVLQRARELSAAERLHLHGQHGYGTGIFCGPYSMPSGLNIRLGMEMTQGASWRLALHNFDSTARKFVSMEALNQPIQVSLTDRLFDACVFCTLQLPLGLHLLVGPFPESGTTNAGAMHRLVSLEGAVNCYTQIRGLVALSSPVSSPWDVYFHFSVDESGGSRVRADLDSEKVLDLLLPCLTLDHSVGTSKLAWVGRKIMSLEWPVVRVHIRLPQIVLVRANGPADFCFPPLDTALQIEHGTLRDGFCVGLHNIRQFAEKVVRAGQPGQVWPNLPLLQWPSATYLIVSFLVALSAGLVGTRIGRENVRRRLLETIRETEAKRSGNGGEMAAAGASWATLIVAIMGVCFSKRALWDAEGSEEEKLRFVGKLDELCSFMLQELLAIGIPLHDRVLPLACWAGLRELAKTAQAERNLELSLIWTVRGAHCGSEPLSLRLASWLLSRGASLDIEDASGRSLLHWAAWGGSPVVTCLLLRTGLGGRALDMVDAHGHTALSMAVMSRSANTVSLLLRASAGVFAPFSRANCLGHSPLELAVRTGAYTLAHSLLEHSASVDVKKAFGLPPSCPAVEAAREITSCLMDSVRRAMVTAPFRASAEKALSHPDASLFEESLVRFSDVGHPLASSLPRPKHRPFARLEVDVSTALTPLAKLVPLLGATVNGPVVRATLSQVPAAARAEVSEILLGAEMGDDWGSPYSCGDIGPARGDIGPNLVRSDAKSPHAVNAFARSPMDVASPLRDRAKWTHDENARELERSVALNVVQELREEASLAAGPNGNHSKMIKEPDANDNDPSPDAVRTGTPETTMPKVLELRKRRMSVHLSSSAPRAFTPLSALSVTRRGLLWVVDETGADMEIPYSAILAMRRFEDRDAVSSADNDDPLLCGGDKSERYCIEIRTSLRPRANEASNGVAGSWDHTQSSSTPLSVILAFADASEAQSVVETATAFKRYQFHQRCRRDGADTSSPSYDTGAEHELTPSLVATPVRGASGARRSVSQESCDIPDDEGTPKHFHCMTPAPPAPPLGFGDSPLASPRGFGQIEFKDEPLPPSPKGNKLSEVPVSEAFWSPEKKSSSSIQHVAAPTEASPERLKELSPHSDLDHLENDIARLGDITECPAVRVVVVGPPRSGKTALVQRLLEHAGTKVLPQMPFDDTELRHNFVIKYPLRVWHSKWNNSHSKQMNPVLHIFDGSGVPACDAALRKRLFSASGPCVVFIVVDANIAKSLGETVEHEWLAALEETSSAPRKVYVVNNVGFEDQGVSCKLEARDERMKMGSEVCRIEVDVLKDVARVVTELNAALTEMLPGLTPGPRAYDHVMQSCLKANPTRVDAAVAADALRTLISVRHFFVDLGSKVDRMQAVTSSQMLIKALSGSSPGRQGLGSMRLRLMRQIQAVLPCMACGENQAERRYLVPVLAPLGRFQKGDAVHARLDDPSSATTVHLRVRFHGGGPSLVGGLSRILAAAAAQQNSVRSFEILTPQSNGKTHLNRSMSSGSDRVPSDRNHEGANKWCSSMDKHSDPWPTLHKLVNQGPWSLQDAGAGFLLRIAHVAYTEPSGSPSKEGATAPLQQSMDPVPDTQNTAVTDVCAAAVHDDGVLVWEVHAAGPLAQWVLRAILALETFMLPISFQEIQRSNKNKCMLFHGFWPVSPPRCEMHVFAQGQPVSVTDDPWLGWSDFLNFAWVLHGAKSSSNGHESNGHESHKKHPHPALEALLDQCETPSACCCGQSAPVVAVPHDALKDAGSSDVGSAFSKYAQAELKALVSQDVRRSLSLDSTRESLRLCAWSLARQARATLGHPTSLPLVAHASSDERRNKEGGGVQVVFICEAWGAAHLCQRTAVVRGSAGLDAWLSICAPVAVALAAAEGETRMLPSRSSKAGALDAVDWAAVAADLHAAASGQCPESQCPCLHEIPGGLWLCPEHCDAG